jgi:Domain of unknown function (DUF4268)
MNLGRLEKVDLRKQWSKEDADFTPWLAQEENIKLLSDAINIELEVQAQEKNVGPFKADILCLDTATDKYVLIENQLERTDHTHLGQLMTYASGLDSVTNVWIAKSFTEEHRAALDWLNSITDDSLNFFGIEIELFRIGDSPVAPMFKIVSKPNDWTKSIRSISANRKLTDTKLQQRDYWQGLKEFLDNKNSKLRMQSPRPQHSSIFRIGKSDFYISAEVNSRTDIISIRFNIKGIDKQSRFEQLFNKYYEKSLSSISKDIDWRSMEDKTISVVTFSKEANFLDSNDRKNQFEWFRENLEKFDKFFRPKIKEL